MKFLIIDDNPADRELIIRQLKSEFPEANFTEIIRQNDLEEALSKADFDVVITDYLLNWTDGLQVLRAVKERSPSIPVVMLTDSGNEQIVVAGMKSGLDDYVLKRNLDHLPAEIKESLGRIRVLEKRRAKTAKEIRESRRQVLDILESISDGFFALDNQWRFTYVNHKAEEFLGKKREALLFKDIWREFPEAVDTTFYNEYHRALEEQKTVSFEEFYPPLGKWFEVHAYPYRNGLSVYFTDITERKRLLDEFNSLLQITDVAIGTLNLDELLDSVLKRLIKVMKADAAVILLREDDSLVTRASYGIEEVRQGFALKIGQGFAGTIARTLQPLYIADAQKDPHVVNLIIKERGIQTMLGVPIVQDGNLIGVLHVDWLSMHPESKAEQHILKVAAD
ncbi:MAG TPA: response regulator, partial [Anaerolineae bacterium]|nr:response regulator [Anaerolineae bacterium]